MTRLPPVLRPLAALAALCVLVTASPSGNGRKFYDDDPLVREPETENAAGVKEWDIDLFYDLAENLFGRPGDSAGPPCQRFFFGAFILFRISCFGFRVSGAAGGPVPSGATWIPDAATAVASAPITK